MIPNLPARTGRCLAMAAAAEAADGDPHAAVAPPPPSLPAPNLPARACDPPPFLEPLGPAVPQSARFAAASRMLARARAAARAT